MTFTAFRGMGAVSEFFMALFMIMISLLVVLLVAAVAAIPLFVITSYSIHYTKLYDFF